MSQQQVAERIGCGLRTYSRYENEGAPIPDRRLYRISEILNVDVQWLLIGDDSSGQNPYLEFKDLQKQIDRLKTAIWKENDLTTWSADMNAVVYIAGLDPLTSIDQRAAILGGEDVYLNVRINTELRSRIDAVASLTGITTQEVVRLAWLTFEEVLRQGPLSDQASNESEK